MKLDLLVVIMGAGEMASGVAWRLHQSRLKVVMTEVAKPLAVRRTVSFCEAVYGGHKTVEGVQAGLITSPSGIAAAHEQGIIPLLVDPGLKALKELQPQVLVEATLRKKGSGLRADMAPLVIGLGPGISAPDEAHYVIETNRGHNLGRIIEKGMAEPDTKVPGVIEGKSWERVLRAPQAGLFEAECQLGDMVKQGQVVGRVNGEPVISRLDGILRGLIRPGSQVDKDLKLGDVDPRGNLDYLHTISEKARALGGSVLEAILRVYN
jgi:xanthine dehydrogenase accessory factor